MFVLQNIPVATRQVAGLTITDNSFDHAPVSNFDLTFNIDEHPDRLDLSLVYNPDLFASSTIERMLDGYQTLLDAVVENRDCPVFELPVISDAERSKQLVAWNATQSSFTADRCIHDLFVEQARRTQTAIALRFEQQEMTYEELDRRSNRLARLLIERGATVDTPVGVCLARSPELIVAILAILKSGAAYLPIDPLYPQARRAAMIADSRVRLIVSDGEVASCLPSGEHRIVLLDADAGAIAGHSDAELERIAGPETIAYVIYTSGSTGEPKGVEVAHRGLVNHALDLACRCELQVGDSLLQYLSLSFDAAAEEIFPALTSGATLQLHPTPAELSGRVLLEWSRDHGVNVLHLPVVVWTSLADEIALAGGGLARHLKTVVVGGDSLPVEQIERWHEATGDTCRFLFAYGVTEATITSTLFDPADGLPVTASSCLPIGRPIANTSLYVLDEFHRPQPVGVAGELYIGGVGVARGYLDRARLTSERFLPNAFAADQGGRMYRTGDLVRYLADGNVEFLGRVDRQVKVHGHRIEPAEIEAVLQLHPQVREAIIVPCGTGPAKRLAAYVGCGSDERPSAEELRKFLASRLPAPMLPAAIVVVETLPRLSCAESRRGGAALTHVGTRGDDGRVRGPDERDRIALGRDLERRARSRAGRDSRKLFRYRRRFDPQHPGRCPRGGRRLAHYAEAAISESNDCRASARRGGGASDRRTARADCRSGLADADSARVFRPGDGRSAPSQPGGDARSGAAGHARNHQSGLANAARASRRPRTRFVPSRDGRWTQSIAEPVEGSPLEVVDCSSLDERAQTAAIECAAAAAQLRLHLEDGPLARFVYSDLGVGRPARLLATIHHLVVDAVSWRILLTDLDMLCHQIAAGLLAQLPAKTTPVTEWSRRLHELADTDEFRGELDAWLAAGAAKPLPREKRDGTNLYGSVGVVRRTLDAATTEGLLGDAQTAYRANARNPAGDAGAGPARLHRGRSDPDQSRIARARGFVRGRRLVAHRRLVHVTLSGVIPDSGKRLARAHDCGP